MSAKVVGSLSLPRPTCCCDFHYSSTLTGAGPLLRSRTSRRSSSAIGTSIRVSLVILSGIAFKSRSAAFIFTGEFGEPLLRLLIHASSQVPKVGRAVSQVLRVVGSHSYRRCVVLTS